MKIACVILGTRGDVQPMVALATGLMKRGHDVLVCAPPENEDLVRQNNCPFIAFGPGIQKEIREKPEKQKGGVAVTISPKEGKKLTMDQMSLLPKLIQGSDLVLGAGIVLGVHTAADIIKAPYRLVAFYPLILGTIPDDPFKNRLMFSIGRSMMNLLIKGFINKFRAKSGLLPIKDTWTHWMGDNVIVACDKELNPARREVSFPFTQTGFMMLPSPDELPDDVKTFIRSGKPPVYIGFGSNPITDPGKYSHIFEKVRDITNQRLIISKGWAELPEVEIHDILFVDEMPFEKLFPEMAAVIHHGGTGTMATVARAGIPQAAFPFMGDQFENRKQIVQSGLGPDTCDFRKMNAESISAAITACVTNESFRKNAAEMAQRLQKINGIDLNVKLIEKQFYPAVCC
jgi:vancomycin aglycone glucosyltransferase